MTPAEIAAIETSVGVRLPESYRVALSNHGLVGADDDHPEFITDQQYLITENKHFKSNPEDISDVRAPGLFGAIKFYLLYGSGKRLKEHRRNWHKKWAIGQRFIIGNDLGEEMYYITLSESTPSVYCYDLETHRSRKIAQSIQDWLLETKRRQMEAESEI